MPDDVIDIASSSEEEADPQADEPSQLSRRDILTPFIQSTVSALGGFEPTARGGQEKRYRLGDSCLGCLKDLKRFWRKDDTDDERTVARIFWETRVLVNDLVPILLETAGRGAVEDKRAIICADLITAMTWPIDLAEELRELDDVADAGTDYSTLIHAQLSYKAALLRPGVLKALMDIMVPCLAKSKRERTARDGQIIQVILHAIRNLAFIKDPPANSFSSSDRAEFSSLQSKLITTMEKSQIFELLLTLAANATDTTYNPYNALILEIFYLLYRGVKPSALVLNQKEKPREDLRKLLEAEAKVKRDENRARASRHSRFGTTIAVRTSKDSYVLHKQKALTADTSTVMDMVKKKTNAKVKKQDELSAPQDLNVDALIALQTVAIGFTEGCFNAFLSSVLKDIKAERPKITEQDNLRLLFVLKWFLEFFLTLRINELGSLNKDGKKGKGTDVDVVDGMTWRFELVGEVVDRVWIGWILKRMRMAMDDKPKQWTELQAGIDCLSQMLLLMEQMSLPTSPDFAHEASKTLQHQLYYNGEILELAFDSLRAYKEQSIAYLDSTIHLAYVLLRMLERWAKTQGHMYVRKSKKQKKKSKKGKVGEEDGIIDVSSDEGEQFIVEQGFNEHMFTFEKFEAKFAQEDITHACLVYLARFREFENAEQMKRVVGLLHRQSVKAKAEGLFFKVTTLDLFQTIIAAEKSLPNDIAYKELMQLINYLLRKFFKAVQEDPLLVVEAFFPKNRGQWKAYSSWEPEEKEKRAARSGPTQKEKKATADVVVKKGYTEEQQLGIAVACLVDEGKMSLVDWVRTTLMTVIGLRLSIIHEVDGDDENGNTSAQQPSAEAMAKIEDYILPYVTEEYAEAATKNPRLKLVLRLVKCYTNDQEADELEWYIPAGISVDELQSSLDTIARYLEEPLDLEGKKPTELLQKKRAARRTTRRTRARSSSASASDSDGDEIPKKRKAKRQKEEILYKSAEFINDSDAEMGDDDVFFRREQEIRDRATKAAVEGGGGLMKATGTKKRKRGNNEDGSGNAKKPMPKGKGKQRASEDHTSEAEGTEPEASRPTSKPRPRPRARFGKGTSTAASSSPPSSPGPSALAGRSSRSSSMFSDMGAPASVHTSEADEPDAADDEDHEEVIISRPTTRRKVVISDDDDD